jgi:hypothetical protein
LPTHFRNGTFSANSKRGRMKQSNTDALSFVLFLALLIVTAPTLDPAHRSLYTLFFGGLFLLSCIIDFTFGIMNWHLKRKGDKLKHIINKACPDPVMPPKGGSLAYEELLRCAQINFENVEKIFPSIKAIPLYKAAKLQLDAGLGHENEFSPKEKDA